MSGAGTGYDLSPTTYNPEGKVYQVDYAIKATENGGTIVGLKCRDGILLAGEKNVVSKMMVEGSNKYIFGITKEIGAVITGVIPDGKAVISRARQEASQYQEFYGQPIKPGVLAERVAQYMYLHTLYGGLRPFGSAIIVAGKYQTQYKLFMLDPSGAIFEYYSCTAGKGSQVCRTEIDKLRLEDLTIKDAVYHVSKM
jgi:20S proteasome subunit alpha 7